MTTMKYYLSKDSNNHVFLWRREPVLSPENIWEGHRGVFLGIDKSGQLPDLSCQEAEISVNGKLFFEGE